MELQWKRNGDVEKRIKVIRNILFPVLGIWAIWSALQGPTVGETQQQGGVGKDPLSPVSCELPALSEELRAASRNGSLVYQKYLRETLIRAAVAASIAGTTKDLPLLFAQERDPAVLEALAMAVVTHADVVEDWGLLRPLLNRLRNEAVPARRAALVRALARTRGPASTRLKQMSTLSYEELIQDPAPEVREAIVANIVAEDSVNPGFPDIPDNAIAVAVRLPDPETGGRILERVSILSASAESIDKVFALLHSGHLALRRGAAKALGTVKAIYAQQAMAELEAQYRIEGDRSVRKNILEAIARLGFTNAVPILVSLQGIDSTLDAEIDIWLEALKLNRQQWGHLQGEKERLAKVRGL